jgi:GDP-L-fucose synthase
MLKRDSKIFVAGKTGMVGAAIIRNLEKKGYSNIVAPSSSELDLTRLEKVEAFFETVRPEIVFLAAAKVGGIYANNNFPGDFIYSNLCIQNNVIHCSYKYKVEKLVFLGSSCIYPKHTQQPIKEEYLLSAPLEPTNEAYAIAKIAGIKMCYYYNKQYGTNFISAMPTNLYGPGDNYNLLNAHVLPALIRKFHEAKMNNGPQVTIWGTGSPLREFMHVDDLADGTVFLAEKYNGQTHINVGSGDEVSIAKLATMVKDVVGFKGELIFDTSKPDGTPRKLMDSSKINELGWRPSISLEKGIAATYEDFKNSKNYRDK